ncbi:MAG TPA: Do family serine endopeptidase [Caulobacteraceae bacterium]|jgi:Do/DeqQ family serine protease|nr:Do family serine endopeptidase [Caulobacteraceae bacterium]
MNLTSKPILLVCLLGLAAVDASCAKSQPANLPPPERREAPPSAAAMRMSFAPIVKRTAPAVVNVFSRRVERTQVDPFWGMFMNGGVPQERIAQSLGSGSIVRADGVILTNHHVIASAQEIKVVTADRREWPATVLLDDPRADLAVLKIDTHGERLPAISIDDTGEVQVGDLVLAIGDPFGVGQTVTNGIVSALSRSDTGANSFSSFIQTDAAINPGNSGGPLVDMDGDLIGVNTAILSGSGTSSGVGFAIPAALAKQVVTTALGGAHEVVRPWLGLRPQAITGDLAKSLGLGSPQGVLAADLWPNGPAAQAGIARGDVIVSVNGQAVNDPTALNYAVATMAPGATVTLGVRKANGPVRTLSVHLATPPDTPAKDQRTLAGNEPLTGATVMNLSPAAADQLGLDPFSGVGVVVSAVGGGYAARLGLQPGDFIREINGTPISTVASLVAAVSTPARVWTIVIERNGQLIRAQVGG